MKLSAIAHVNSKLDGSAFKVFMAIVQAGRGRISRKDLELATGLQRTTIHKTLKKLRAAQLIEGSTEVAANGDNLPMAYSINWEAAKS